MKHRFMPLRSRYRATFSGTGAGVAPERIDAESETLHGVQIALEGEALGHGVWLDREFCEAVAAAGNATGDIGLKVRYGHPAMCADALGTELGRARNFRVVDVARKNADGASVVCAGVVADVQLLKSAHSAPQGDIAKHVLEMAAEDPAQFGQSIVFTYADWVVKDADGVRHSYKAEVAPDEEDPPDGEEPRKKIPDDEWRAQSADGRVYAVLGKLHGADFTDTPAATDGVFSTGTLAEEAERMLDEHPQVFDAIEKNPKSLVEFLARTGLDKRLESARVAGLQAAKDKEIAALRARCDETEAQRSALAAQIDQLNSDIAATKSALAAADAAVKQLTADGERTAEELSKTKAALAAETERYREQVGLALRMPDANGGKTGLSLVRSVFPE